MVIKVCSVNGCMATTTVTRSFIHSAIMIAISNAPGPIALPIRLSMTTHTKTAVSGNKHFVMNRAMNLMAAGTSFSERLVLEHKRSALLLMTFETKAVNTIE